MSKRYAEYVDSGVPWLGDVPAGWTTRPLWSMFERIKDVGHPDEQMLSVFRDYGVVAKDSRSNINKTAENRNIYQLVHPGWLVTNRMKAWQGSVGISGLRGIVSGHYICFAPRHDADSRYLNWLFRSPTYAAGYALQSRGVRIGQAEIDNDLYRVMPVLLPPIEEQRAIAEYLDRETAGIDTLVEEQQRLIEMLHERREATIRRALLSGLEAADTVPSGVESLGDIPKYWRMVPTRYLCTITTGSEDSGNATDDGDYPFYVRGRQVLRIDHYSFDDEAVMTPGDGQGGTGKVFHYFNGKFEAHQRVYVFKDFVGISGRYFYYFLSTFLRPVALAGSNTVTMESLRRPLLANFKVALPPLDEQRRITAYLDERTSKIDALIAETEQFIELARERRTALITAAVTGQVDGREVA
ncbi:restriction endonuclease subunit S [Actinomadura litoris]|uniref:restriction endonuclease subunit S n=1 Tax=Actinomadura litoris TaxID=2678616 RepID=UPI001FA6ADA2|nr:restriction endonuclease subunit S [Actinomadura litoris]